MTTQAAVFDFTPPKSSPVPILLSIPHSGTSFPENWSQDRLLSSFQRHPPDTDWFVDRLYAFAPKMGIGIVKANYSRYVVDLNRDPYAKPLYNDGRLITGPIPTQSFAGENLYKTPPTDNEKEDRLNRYFVPYHKAIRTKIQELHQVHGRALLFDAHSIRHFVPTLYPKPFPDLILGNNDETTAKQVIIEACWKILDASNYQAAHNSPFKGGFITRNYGNPKQNIHSLQLEMSQKIYMDEDRCVFDEKKAKRIQVVLENMFQAIIESL